MGDSTTIALNLTFFGTLGLPFLMFLGLFLLVILTLVLAGVGRLLVLTVQALFGRLPKNETLPLVRLTGETGHPADAPEATPDDAAAAPSPAKPPRARVLRGVLLAPRDWRKALHNGRDFLKPSELAPRSRTPWSVTRCSPQPGASRRCWPGTGPPPSRTPMPGPWHGHGPPPPRSR